MPPGWAGDGDSAGEDYGGGCQSCVRSPWSDIKSWIDEALRGMENALCANRALLFLLDGVGGVGHGLAQTHPGIERRRGDSGAGTLDQVLALFVGCAVLVDE